MPPVRKQDVFFVARLKLRVKGQQVFLFRRIISLSMNDHGGYSDSGRIQDWKMRVFDDQCYAEIKVEYANVVTGVTG